MSLPITSPSSLNRAWSALLIAAAAGVLAFQISTAYRREIIHYDEGYYLCEARGLRELIQSLPGLIRHRNYFSEWKTSVRRTGAILPPGNGKPTFIFFLALASMLPVREACAGDLLTLWGCLAGVACFFFLCKRFGHSVCAALALSLLFFVSPIWNYYSVTTFANPLSAAILLGGILCYMNGKWFRACLLFGLSFTVHYSAITVAGILLCAMAVELWRQPIPGQQRCLKSIQYAMGLSLPFLVWQALYLAGRTLTRNHLSDVVYRTYWEQLTYNYSRVTSDLPDAWTLAIHRNLGIFSALTRTETWPMACLLGMSPCVVLILWRNLSLRERALGLAALIVPAFWLLNPGTVVSRVVLTFLPLLYLSFALMVSRWDRLRSLSRPFQTMALLILTGISFNQTLRNGLMLRSPFKAASSYLQQQGFVGQVADVNCWPIWQLYEKTRMEFRPETLAPGFSQLPRLMSAAIAENRSQMVPVIVYNGQSMENSTNGAEFSRRLLTLPLSAQWPMPYKQIPIFTTEAFGDVMTTDARGRTGGVALYWVDRSSMRSLFPE